MVLWILSSLSYSVCSYFIVGTTCNKDDMFESGVAVQNCSAIGGHSVIPASQVH